MTTNVVDHQLAWLMMEGVLDEDDSLPLKDIDDAIKAEMEKLQYSRLRTPTGAGKSDMSPKHSKSMHTEL